MLLPLLRRTGPLVLVMSLALPVVAAPLPKTDRINIEKYLLDDADGVLVVNLKQVLASPAYKKAFQKQLTGLLASPEAQAYLKDVGFDPLKDIDHIVLCIGKSCWPERARTDKGPSEEGPYLLFQGKFDAAKLKAKMAALAKKANPKAAISDEAGTKIYQLGRSGRGPFAAQVDATTVVLAGKRAQVVEAIAKAAGKKKTRFVSKDVPVLLKKLKSDVAIQGFALSSFITDLRATRIEDARSKRELQFERETLGRLGFKAVMLSIGVKDTASGSLVFTLKDKAQLKARSDSFHKGLQEAGKEISRVAGSDRQLMPLVRFLGDVSIKSAGETITMEGKADVETIQALLLALGRSGL
jgi:hypothetical protein